MAQPQPAPYYPPPPPPHSHDKYVGAIVGVGFIALIVGAAIGYGLGISITTRTLGTSPQPQQRQFTFTHGTVDIGRSGSQYYPDSVFFDNQNTGTLASPIFENDTYQLYLESGRTYQVTIYWYESTFTSRELRECQARPQPFTPTGTSYTQNFLC